MQSRTVNDDLDCTFYDYYNANNNNKCWWWLMSLMRVTLESSWTIMINFENITCDVVEYHYYVIKSNSVCLFQSMECGFWIHLIEVDGGW